MKLITAKSTTPHDSSFSFSRRYFHWKKKTDDEDDEEEVLTFSSSSHFCEEGIKDEEFGNPLPAEISSVSTPRKKQSNSKLRSALTLFGKSRSSTRVIGTLFGYRRGHAHIAFQEDAKQDPAFFIELATTTSVLVREMASGLVRIALVCEKRMDSKKGKKLLEETLWRTYCNGKKCGLAIRRECGAEELKVLKAVEPISMGAGVLPGSASGNGAGSEGELMYMRARFERVVGSKDHSQAFYMINPDGAGGPELSVYLLRV
ncbi:hypothetical protein I3760_06G062000 [Carya illinoinensis]|uniref:Protein MIZU-KUSSEI 1 n=1 Tax=Carya illinoinensis TaxID=32201 RepID=A0A8T1Q8K2_CARIL|nr:protein MIZU-KUSSEI 1-like [Carya illinoinensis]KAG2701831.1 hypothetical protein I3760_06G062000 [Carya illinoinensis]KAG6650729.1 hypothetical protein CIPAW_06G062400 [Carya illinoinensis]KAG6708086.1 hypothetical protein I3842_06G062300 [Carya illinoinensis]